MKPRDTQKQQQQQMIRKKWKGEQKKQTVTKMRTVHFMEQRIH